LIEELKVIWAPTLVPEGTSVIVNPVARAEAVENTEDSAPKPAETTKSVADADQGKVWLRICSYFIWLLTLSKKASPGEDKKEAPPSEASRTVSSSNL
jgi:hypothetical protein